ncbi:MAG: hypothetical protein E7616_03820 [Ruminococcaceae bacterium]|nr:hypothetical protein [Oscillospiraceae bacterium]
MKVNKTVLKLTGGIVTVIVLATCLAVTTFALAYTTVLVEYNVFHTGKVEINLNNSEPIIREDEFLFEPGMTVKKDFFIENNSTLDVYYKIYFGNVEGTLKDILEIKILEGDMVLWSGTAAELHRKGVAAADDTLAIGEKKWLTVLFHFPETAGNEMKNATLSFDLCADAVQTKNNPNKLFE